MESIKSNKTLYYTSLAMLLLSIAFAFGISLDTRLVSGINPWIKPLKFSISIFIYTFTMIYVLRHHNPKEQTRYSSIIAGTMWIEMLLIALQAGRGVRSHFNQDSVFDIAVFGIMGIAILVNTITIFVITKSFFKNRNSNFESNELLAIKYGLVLFLIGSLEGGFMSSHASHTVGALDGGPGIPFLNWSTIAGDLRISHFIGLHGLQILLLIFLCSKHLLRIPNAGISSKVSLAIKGTTVMILALAVFTFVQALNGFSFIIP